LTKVSALFLDRDGVINEEVNYAHKPSQISFVPGIFSLVQTANNHGMPVIVVTNQAGIAKGYYTEQQFLELMRWMQSVFLLQGCRLDDVYFCPHHPESITPHYRKDCDCRKPKPGMLLCAANEHGIDLTNSCLVGDKWSDIEAGYKSGLRKLFLLNGTQAGPESSVGARFDVKLVKSLNQVEPYLANRYQI
jgi:D-glycero-D-manno-heptose 1,7-bisphosphate phosphatase